VIGGTDYETLRQWRDLMLDRMRADARFVNPTSSYQENKPELRVRIDRLKAADLGVSIEAIGRTLETLFGSREVTNTYVDRGEEYKVIMQARAEDRATPQDLASVFVRSGIADAAADTAVEPGHAQEAAGPQELNRVDRLRSITLRASPRTRLHASARRLETMERFASEVLPREVRISYQGQSREFKESSSSLYITFALALLVVFLVLAAQFESWIHPLIIMLAVPLAVTGGLGALWFTGHQPEHLQPDRHDPADRPDGEERHPDRRVRQSAARRGQVGLRRGARSLRRTAASDPDDLDRDRVRRGAARLRAWRGRREPFGDRLGDHRRRVLRDRDDAAS
jgi:multidrug efflux pump